MSLFDIFRKKNINEQKIHANTFDELTEKIVNFKKSSKDKSIKVYYLQKDVYDDFHKFLDFSNKTLNDRLGISKKDYSKLKKMPDIKLSFAKDFKF